MDGGGGLGDVVEGNGDGGDDRYSSGGQCSPMIGGDDGGDDQLIEDEDRERPTSKRAEVGSVAEFEAGEPIEVVDSVVADSVVEMLEVGPPSN